MISTNFRSWILRWCP